MNSTNATSRIDIGDVIDASPVSRLQTTVFILCSAVALLDGFDTQAIAFAVPVMANEWGVPLASFGVVFGAGLLGICVGSLLIAPLADRIGRRKVIIGSTAAFGVLALGTLLSQSVSSAAAWRFATGLGLGGAMPNLIAMVAEYAPARKRAFLITASFCGFPLGGAIGGIVAAQLVPVHGWHAIFWVGGIVPLIFVPVLLAWLPESPRYLAATGRRAADVSVLLNRICMRGAIGGIYTATQTFVVRDAGEGTSERTPVSVLFKDGKALFTVLLWVVFFCSLLIMYFLFSWLPSVLQKSGLPLQVAINAAVILNIGGIVGGLLIGRQVDRHGPLKILAATYGLGALAVAGIGVYEQAAVATLVAAFLSGVFIIGSQFAMNALAAHSYPTSARSTGVGWALGVGRVGSVVAPLLGSTLVDSAMSTSSLFVCAALPALVSALCLVALQGRRTVMREPSRTGQVTP